MWKKCETYDNENDISIIHMIRDSQVSYIYIHTFGGFSKKSGGIL